MINIEKCCIITFFTTSGVIELENRCRNKHIEGKIVPVPRNITADCGLAFKGRVMDKHQLMLLCDGLDFDKYYEIEY